jgi:hypothetical protein
MELTVDGEVRQSGSAADMVFSVPEIIEFVSSWITLEQVTSSRQELRLVLVKPAGSS